MVGIVVGEAIPVEAGNKKVGEMKQPLRVNDHALLVEQEDLGTISHGNSPPLLRNPPHPFVCRYIPS
jgi:hypothetical protein